jgi:hypothetical protein
MSETTDTTNDQPEETVLPAGTQAEQDAANPNIDTPSEEPVQGDSHPVEVDGQPVQDTSQLSEDRPAGQQTGPTVFDHNGNAVPTEGVKPVEAGNESPFGLPPQNAAPPFDAMTDGAARPIAGTAEVPVPTVDSVTPVDRGWSVKHQLQELGDGTYRDLETGNTFTEREYREALGQVWIDHEEYNNSHGNPYAYDHSGVTGQDYPTGSPSGGIANRRPAMTTMPSMQNVPLAAVGPNDAAAVGITPALSDHDAAVEAQYARTRPLESSDQALEHPAGELPSVAVENTPAEGDPASQ